MSIGRIKFPLIIMAAIGTGAIPLYLDYSDRNQHAAHIERLVQERENLHSELSSIRHSAIPLIPVHQVWDKAVRTSRQYTTVRVQPSAAAIKIPERSTTAAWWGHANGDVDEILLFIQTLQGLAQLQLHSFSQNGAKASMEFYAIGAIVENH